MPHNTEPPRVKITTTTLGGFTPGVDTRQPEIRPQPLHRKPKRGFRIFFIILTSVLLIGIGLLTGRFLQLSTKIFVGQKNSFTSRIKSIFQGSTGQLQLEGEDLGQINILLLGIGGEGHDGPYLTDTLILAQIRPDLNAISFISIPRDYLIDTPGLQGRKINAAFAEGMARSNKDWATGGEWAREAVESISGLKIPYFAVVDFRGFEKAVDEVGGLDITIERTFTDYSFPNDATNGYLPPVTFTQGFEHMNGKRALIFARSRHAAGLEGSDFARSTRQQKIIHAFKDKVVNLNLITDANTINKLLGVVADHFHTNLQPEELFHLYSLVKNYQKNQLLFLNLDPITNLICPQILEENSAYVLVPCPGKNELDIEQFFKNSFTIGKLANEKSTVWIADASKNTKNFQYAEKTLTDAGITVYQTGFSATTTTATTFFQVNPKPATADFLKNSLGATELSSPPADFKINKDKVDIILVLGTAFKIPIGNSQRQNSRYDKYKFRTGTSSPEENFNTATTTPDNALPRASSTQITTKKATTSPDTARSSTPTSTDPFGIDPKQLRPK